MCDIAYQVSTPEYQVDRIDCNYSIYNHASTHLFNTHTDDIT